MDEAVFAAIERPTAVRSSYLPTNIVPTNIVPTNIVPTNIVPNDAFSKAFKLEIAKIFEPNL